MRISDYLIILTFLFFLFNLFYKNVLFIRQNYIYYTIFPSVLCTRNCYNTFMTKNNTGTYIYDKQLKKVVKVSDRIPSVGKAPAHTCSGCCGHCACHED